MQKKFKNCVGLTGKRKLSQPGASERKGFLGTAEPKEVNEQPVRKKRRTTRKKKQLRGKKRGVRGQVLPGPLKTLRRKEPCRGSWRGRHVEINWGHTDSKTIPDNARLWQEGELDRKV